MSECQVCISVSRKELVECPKCQYSACVSCIKTYLLQSHYDAHCMNCRHTWDRRFMMRYFSKNFMTTEYKKHRANVLYERERSLFPETVHLIEEDIRKEGIQAEIVKLHQKKREIDNEIYRLSRQLYNRPSMNKEKIHSVFVRPCVYENCRGYLNEKDGKCAICHHYTCLECNVQIESTEGHECKEDDRENWKHIKSTTKPCPSCNIRIHRISGCRQMWCPQCHTAFDYTTGKIETGIIHNPHYYEYLQKTGARAVQHNNNGPGHCERMMQLYDLQRVTEHQTDAKDWTHFYRCLNHIHLVELPRYRSSDTTPLHTITLRLRKEYIRNFMSEEQYKKRVQEYEKKLLKEKEMFTLLQSFYTIGVDLLRSLNRNDDETLWQLKREQREYLRSFMNESIKEISFQFQSRGRVLDEKFQFV